jgi:hypothetical protein
MSGEKATNITAAAHTSNARFMALSSTDGT